MSMNYKVSLDLYNKLYQKYNLNTIKKNLSTFETLETFETFDTLETFNKLSFEGIRLNQHLKYKPEKDEHIVCLSDEFYNFLKKNDCSINKIINYNKLYRAISNITNSYNLYSYTNNFYMKTNKYNMIYYKFKQIMNSNYIRKKVLIINFINEYTYSNQKDDIRIYI